MSLASVGGQEAFCSPFNPYWYSNTWLNYTATVHNVTRGLHYLRIDVIPESIRTRDINSQDQPLVNFTVINQPSTQLNSSIPTTKLVTIFVTGCLVAVAAVTAAKKCKRSHVIS